MPQPPKCSVCDAAHWGNQPHVFQAVSITQSASTGVVVDPAELESLRALAAKVSARKAKWAAYMRGYRATHPRRAS